MLFSTKAEYGIRLMVDLGRREGGPPVALAALADAESLPLSYLEHLVAKLRDAGLVTSQRGAHGGYRLALPASEIRMLEVVEALEGPIAPMDCFTPEEHGEARGLLLARVRRGHRLLDQAALDQGPRRHHTRSRRHHAGRARRLRNARQAPRPPRPTPNHEWSH